MVLGLVLTVLPLKYSVKEPIGFSDENPPFAELYNRFEPVEVIVVPDIVHVERSEIVVIGEDTELVG